MLSYTINRDQLAILEGLAYRNADTAYLKERYGEDARDEINVDRDAVDGLLRDADELKIPFWLQNLMLEFYDNWRLWKETNVRTWLTHHKGYKIEIGR